MSNFYLNLCQYSDFNQCGNFNQSIDWVMSEKKILPSTIPASKRTSVSLFLFLKNKWDPIFHFTPPKKNSVNFERYQNPSPN